ncbi:HupE/UreJ family protein [Ichthyenterobacterium magnum]|uniref:HupE/UreJ protein n=1 Tax=Ichthyenterobacterium magnum TaxID=1230530 RepID=A0A420DXQ5_9FLAO|nr:HupE/UreJ family protein [Ichthyenterobacterium magnum]RKE99005.1 HupE/UreJ protein [Ichthyenterobacterium magnum]
MLDNFLSNLQDGMYHVLNINAYDHILFLVVIAIPYVFKDWKRVLLLVTVFTLGHTLALALATYDVISINRKWIAFLIPIAILIIALFNVFTAGKKSQQNTIGILFFVSLFLGLLHGLGFVNTFESLISNSENKLIALLEMSLGLEIGQLIIAFIVLFLSFICQTIFRFSKRDWVMVLSAIVIGFILPMLINSNLFS